MEFPRILDDPIALDFETTGLNYWHEDFRVLGFSIATTDAQWYWDIREYPNAVDWLRDLIRGRLVVAQFAQFENQCCRVLHIDPRQSHWYCTMTAECLIDEHRLTYDLYSICQYHGIDSQKHVWLNAMQTDMGAKNHDAVLASLDAAPPDLVSGYGSSDTRDCFDVYLAQQPLIEEQELQRLIELEMDLVPVLAEMSWHGVRVDLEAAHASIPVLTEKADILQLDINREVGRPFNVNSTPQIRDFFKPEPISKYQYRLIDGTIVGLTKSGKGPSLDQVAMRDIQHPLAAKILQLRKTIKLRDTFVCGHIIGHADSDGYVHTTFNQTRNDADAGTVTGRLSSTDPALQQITKRDKENAAILRAMFLADKREEWTCMDYSQVDFRCGAHLQDDASIIAAYTRDPSLDYHQIVSDITGIPRNAPYAGAPYSKQINLGLSFGAGAGKIAFMMKMPYTIKEMRGKMVYVPGDEAKRVFDLYHKKLPNVATFMKKAENVAKSTGYVKTSMGRRIRFPLRKNCHKAAGLLYQAYAADLHKVGLVRVDRAIRSGSLPARLMMSCHDEIGVSMPPDVDPRVKETLLYEYTDFHSEHAPIKMKVPITASGKVGINWYEASKD